MIQLGKLKNKTININKTDNNLKFNEHVRNLYFKPNRKLTVLNGIISLSLNTAHLLGCFIEDILMIEQNSHMEEHAGLSNEYGLNFEELFEKGGVNVKQ